MKTISFLGFVTILAVLLFGQVSCIDTVRETHTFMANKPVYMSYEKLRSSVKASDSRTLKNTGKIYFYNNYIFINEAFEGVHVIDNSNPTNPLNIKFIEIPGNVDIEIKNNRMYADSYVDLVVLNISDLENISEIHRLENEFPYAIREYDTDFPLANIDESQGVVNGWTIETVRQENEYSWTGSILKAEDVDYEEAQNDGGDGGSGTGGSMARFAQYENMLYLLHNSVIKTYSIASEVPVLQSEMNTGRVSETLFVHEGNLFSGTQTGMVVYSLDTPSNPQQISAFEHIQSCDPVAVEGDYAYVTLRAGTVCGGGSNQLDVINISNILSPRLEKSYFLTEPHGLGIRNNTLFVCDGSAGLKVYDATDPLSIEEHLLQEFTDIHAYDVIPFDTRLFLIGNDGFYQYAWAQGEPLTLLSHIPTE